MRRIGSACKKAPSEAQYDPQAWHVLLLLVVQEQSPSALQRKKFLLILMHPSLSGAHGAAERPRRVRTSRMCPAAKRGQLNMFQHVSSCCTTCDAVEWKYLPMTVGEIQEKKAVSAPGIRLLRIEWQTACQKLDLAAMQVIFSSNVLA